MEQKFYTEEELIAIKEYELRTKENIIFALEINYDIFGEDTVKEMVNILNKMELPDLTNCVDENNHPFIYSVFYNQESMFPCIEVSIELIDVLSFYTGYDSIEDCTFTEIDQYNTICKLPILTMPVYIDQNTDTNKEFVKNIINDPKEFECMCSEFGYYNPKYNEE